jgi:cyanophycinase
MTAFTGPIALLGSGEYTPAMYETDRYLLSGQGTEPRVALIPAASGLEPGSPERWNAQGAQHFTELGAAVRPLGLTRREHAYDPQIVAELGQAGLIYFSGGNPEYLVATLHETPAWETIVARHKAGSAIAGCSAGAMMLGGYTIRVRQVAAGQPPSWVAGLGVVPSVAVLPHFDRMASFVGEEVFRKVVESAPADVTLVGIDEDTALVRVGAGRWRVMGRQTVTLFGPGGDRLVYRPGEELDL